MNIGLNKELNKVLSKSSFSAEATKAEEKIHETGFPAPANNSLPGPHNPAEIMDRIGRLMSVMKAGVEPIRQFL